MWRINWLADSSPRGLNASCSMMVNYRYYLKDTEEYSRLYMQDHVIQASERVLELLNINGRAGNGDGGSAKDNGGGGDAGGS